MKKDTLILGCGIGRCGTGFLSYFMFLNPNIAVWDGPGMQALYDHVKGKTGLPLRDLHSVWGDDYQSPDQGSENHLPDWPGKSKFAKYRKERLKTRRNSKAYFIAHLLGERFYSTYRDHFDCNIMVMYCARDIVDHYRSFIRWGTDVTPDYFLDKVRASVKLMESIQKEVPVVSINIPEYTLQTLRAKMNKVMKATGVAKSKEQTEFLKERRKIGQSIRATSKGKRELVAELETVQDYPQIKDAYDRLRKTHEA